MSGTQRRAGFTLIELLVVIAIIAILAAILFPVFARAQQKAVQASDMSNIKQLLLGVLMYVQDNDECMPPSERTPSTRGWHYRVEPYVKNRAVFRTPGYRFATTSSSLRCHYGFNYGGGDTYLHEWPGLCMEGGSKGVDLARINRPAQTFCLMNAAYKHYVGPKGSHKASSRKKYTVTLDYSSWRKYYGMFTDGLNMGYVDGHGKWHRTSWVESFVYPDVGPWSRNY